MYSYQKITISQIPAALALVKAVFLEFEAPDYSAAGIAEFLSFIDADAIKQKIITKEMKIWYCHHQGEIVGVLAASANHINLLFVKAEHHRRGIAKRLLKNLITNTTADFITVNSSPYAIPVYQKMGFVTVAEEQVINGIRFTAMKLFLRKENDKCSIKE